MRKALGLVLVFSMILTVSCTDGGADEAEGREGAPTTDPSEETGLIDAATWKERQDAYLRWVNARPIDEGDPLDLLARGVDEPVGSPDRVSSAQVEDFQPIIDKLETFTDTGDFDINNLLHLWLRNKDDLDPVLAAAIRKRILDFKYWWTEPTPTGVVDNQYYWSENHQLIFLANEYIAGQTFPDTAFTNSGMTGREHIAHAEERLDTWFDWRSRFGFSEWLSNVYWNENMKGLLLLAEFADDPELARRASMLLDVLFVELAGHLHDGTFGATHGRTYQKDKLDGRDEDTFTTAKLAFDQTPEDYVNVDDAVLLATAERYRPPEVAQRIAASDETTVFQTRAGIPLDPHAPIDPSVEAPYGLSFEGEEGLMAFWGMGAQFPWQVAPLSVATVRFLDLFQTTNFQKASAFEPVIRDADDDTARSLTQALATQVNPGLLSQVNTYTWRSPDVMLSTAQDWRPGQRGEQDHIWQATLGTDALVFTQHPHEPVPSKESPNDNDGYWTGDGAMPRSAQVENVSISIYAPQYDGGGGSEGGAYSFTFEPYTHAYFPTEAFDEVVERDGWVIGRKGDGYVALWSSRPTRWRDYDVATEFTGRLETGKFDLIADGGPDNVWITEVGRAADHEGEGDPFDAFVEQITASKPEVSPPLACAFEPPCPAGAGATVRYASPSQGEITFGWTPIDPTNALPPLTVAGASIDLHPEAFRWEAPWSKSAWDSGVYEVSYEGATLDLDFTKTTRRAAAD